MDQLFKDADALIFHRQIVRSDLPIHIDLIEVTFDPCCFDHVFEILQVENEGVVLNNYAYFRINPCFTATEN